MSVRPLLLGASLSLAVTTLASAQLVKFELLEETFSALDLTPDGQHVVGVLSNGGAFLWSRAAGYTPLGGIAAFAVSDDGTVVLGSIDDGVAPQDVAAIWTAADGWQSLGTLDGTGTTCGSSSSSGSELSADGSVAVGLGYTNVCSGTGFRWTAEEGMVPLEFLANGSNRAAAVSGDGTLIGGYAQGTFRRTPAIWSADGSGQLLDPPNGDVQGEVRAISDDGTILLGEWDLKAFKWVEGQEIEIFDTVVAGWAGAAVDIADDGTIIGYDRLSLGAVAWIRPNGGPAVDLRSYLLSLGTAGVPAALNVTQAISANGNIVLGWNYFGTGWIINLCAGHRR